MDAGAREMDMRGKKEKKKVKVYSLQCLSWKSATYLVTTCLGKYLGRYYISRIGSRKVKVKVRVKVKVAVATSETLGRTPTYLPCYLR